MRESLKQSLIPTRVADSSFLTDAELDRLLRLTGETRDVNFVVLPAPAPDAAPVSDADIKRWYDTHAASFREPETVTLEYIDLDASKLVVPAPSEDALRERFQQQQAHAAAAGQRLASHILVKVDAGANEAAWKAAEAKAERIATQARQPGADFAALARADSQDEGSKAAGGDLGWIEKGAMPKPFEDALFAMQAGTGERTGTHRVRLARDQVARGQGRHAGELRTGARPVRQGTGRRRPRSRLQRPHRQGRR